MSKPSNIIDLTIEVEKRVLAELNELAKYDGKNLRHKILKRRLELKDKLEFTTPNKLKALETK